MRRRRGYPVWLVLAQRGHCLVRLPAERKPRPRHLGRLVVVFTVAALAAYGATWWWHP